MFFCFSIPIEVSPKTIIHVLYACMPSLSTYALHVPCFCAWVSVIVCGDVGGALHAPLRVVGMWFLFIRLSCCFCFLFDIGRCSGLLSSS